VTGLTWPPGTGLPYRQAVSASEASEPPAGDPPPVPAPGPARPSDPPPSVRPPQPGGPAEPAEHAARLMEWQGYLCQRMGSTLYAGLLPLIADDLRQGGPTVALLDGYLNELVASALPLRLLGAAHALALTGQAPDLAACYPSAGGSATAGPDATWAALRQVLTERGPFIRDWLRRPPQTNEPGRGAVLIGGLQHIAAQAGLPVRLVEIGASAGLNLRADHFRVAGETGHYGARYSPVVLTGAWRGTAPPAVPFHIVERSGGDLDPIDPVSYDGSLRLTAFVWPDQADRLDRLRGALALARVVPADLRQEPATATLARTRLRDGTWTVVWHSAMIEYLDPAQQAEVAAGIAVLGAAATETARFAYLTLEPAPERGPFPVTLTTWPGATRRVLGHASPHGMPVTWLPAGG
jgi:hypothetical protein